MVVDEDQRGCGQLQRALDDLARIDGRMVHGSVALHFIRNEKIALVEKQDSELFTLCESHRGAAIVEHVLPRSEEGAFADGAARQPPRRGLDDLEIERGRLADAIDFRESLGAGAEHLGEGAEAGDERLGEGLDVALGDRAEQHEFEEFVIRQSGFAGVPEAFAQTRPVALVVRLGRRRDSTCGCVCVCGFGGESLRERPRPPFI